MVHALWWLVVAKSFYSRKSIKKEAVLWLLQIPYTIYTNIICTAIVTKAYITEKLCHQRNRLVQYLLLWSRNFMRPSIHFQIIACITKFFTFSSQHKMAVLSCSSLDLIQMLWIRCIRWPSSLLLLFSNEIAMRNSWIEWLHYCNLGSSCIGGALQSLQSLLYGYFSPLFRTTYCILYTH